MSLIKTILLWVISLWLALLAYNTVFPPISTLMAARVFTLQKVERKYVPLRRMSPNLVRAVIAAEDGRFCDHQGIDWKAMKAVVSDVVEDDASHGGSTIAMQTAKNLFLWHGFSYIRKPIELPLAMLLDTAWGKRRVMDTYLNVAEFGRGVFGAEAASRRYFHKSAANLSAREAALLAAVLPSPRRRNPAHPTAFVSNYASSIERRMGGVESGCALRR
jgi:monofunctional biosynthetic peptidoglycan transglycosylase